MVASYRSRPRNATGKLHIYPDPINPLDFVAQSKLDFAAQTFMRRRAELGE
jgi:hypothetical protein